MSKDTYLSMVEQMGKEVDLDEMPPGLEDFPDIAIDAINVFNSLGDRVFPEIGYIGKDYTSLPLYLEIHKVEDKELFTVILLRLDAAAIEEAQKQLKAEYDRIKRKSR